MDRLRQIDLQPPFTLSHFFQYQLQSLSISKENGASSITGSSFMACGIEAFTHGNMSPLFERNFSYRMSPVLRATL